MDEITSIRCMQLPLLDLQLLLPNSAVAEIIGYTQPEEEFAGSGWYDGLIFWRGVMVPVVSVEKMCQMSTVEPGARTRIAIVYNPQGEDDIPYIGLIMQDIPRAYLAEQERLDGAIDSPDCEFLLSRLDIMIEQLVIPDLDAITIAIRQQMSH